jgi:hypothetical protein
MLVVGTRSLAFCVLVCVHETCSVKSTNDMQLFDDRRTVGTVDVSEMLESDELREIRLREL